MNEIAPRRIVLEESPGKGWSATLCGENFTVRDERYCGIAIKFAMRKRKWEGKVAAAKAAMMPVVPTSPAAPPPPETVKAPAAPKVLVAPAPKPWTLVIPKEKPSAKR